MSNCRDPRVMNRYAGPSGYVEKTGQVCFSVYLQDTGEPPERQARDLQAFLRRYDAKAVVEEEPE
jgi:hypothetical protein